MHWSDVTAPPTDRKLRQFAAVGVIVLAVLAIWQLRSSGSLVLAGCYAAVAVLVGGVGFARPKRLAPIFTLWMIAAFPLAWVVSTIVLAVIFFGLLTPLGLVFRLMGRDPLDRAWPGRQDSYWQEKPVTDKPERYLRQY